MRSTVFRFDSSTSNFTHRESAGQHEYEFDIPILDAFAVEHFQVQFLLDNGRLCIGKSTLRNRCLTIEGPALARMAEYEITLTVHFHGIRDYSLLFPWVSEAKLRSRLGDFYREADAAFDSASWLSFSLMCGALFEGILYARTNTNDSFSNLIATAESSGDIDSDTAQIMHKVRGYRNLVHANRYNTAFVTRADAMDTRTVLDRLLRDAR